MPRNKLLSGLQQKLGGVNLIVGDSFSWSARHKTITYPPYSGIAEWDWALLHEAGHAMLKHKDYNSDFELLLIEIDAWDEAVKLAKEFKIEIDKNHIEDCLDTYRDWLYARSTCPTCTSSSLQTDELTYKCFNCQTVWRVSSSRHCRPYRLKTVSKV